MEQLECEALAISGLEIETTTHSFEIRCESLDGLHEIILFHDGKVWLDEKMTENPLSIPESRTI